MAREIVMYTRTLGCPFISVAKRVLNDHALSYRELFIDRDAAARQRVLDWTGFLSVPTLVIAEAGDDLPYEAAAFLPQASTPRGVNRGSMITEPNIDQLTNWLRQHGFITAPTEDDALSAQQRVR